MESNNNYKEYPVIVETFNKAKTLRFHFSLILEIKNFAKLVEENSI